MTDFNTIMNKLDTISNVVKKDRDIAQQLKDSIREVDNVVKSQTEEIVQMRQLITEIVDEMNLRGNALPDVAIENIRKIILKHLA